MKGEVGQKPKAAREIEEAGKEGNWDKLKAKKFAGLVTDRSQSAAVILTDCDRSVKTSDMFFFYRFSVEKIYFR